MKRNLEIDNLIKELEPVVESGRDELNEKVRLAINSHNNLEIYKWQSIRAFYYTWVYNSIG